MFTLTTPREHNDSNIPKFVSPLTPVGILYTVLSCVLFVLAYVRQRHGRHDFADRRDLGNDKAIKTLGQTGKRIFGRPFVTAGWIVVALALIVAFVEITLLVLVFKV